MFKNSFCFLCLFAAAFSGPVASSAYAGDEIAVEQAKLNTEDAGPVEPGDFEFEFAFYSPGRTGNFYREEGARAAGACANIPTIWVSRWGLFRARN